VHLRLRLRFSRRLPRAGVRLIAHHLTVSELNNPAAILGDVMLVGDHNDRDSAVSVQSLKDAHDLNAGRCIEISRGLVGEHD
jgi:hypothetical protein